MIGWHRFALNFEDCFVGCGTHSAHLYDMFQRGEGILRRGTDVPQCVSDTTDTTLRPSSAAFLLKV